MTDTNFHLGHRQRLREKFLNNKITEYELLELFLTYSIPRRDVRTIARDLIKTFGSIYGVVTAPVEALENINGIKEHSAVFLKIAHEIMKLGQKDILKDAPVFHDIKQVFDYVRITLSGKTIEEFHVLYLTNDYKLIQDDLHSSGTIDWSAVYTREIVKKALSLNAGAVIFMHNHPTGGKSFSMDDVNITLDLKEKLSVMDVEFFDHYLFAEGLVYSMKDCHYLK